MINNTLWSVLKERMIEIPLIQRDYAQGRIGKEHLRERFIGKMVDTLRMAAQMDFHPMTLDFVYGTVENGAMLPLDGQQRLTTLWLLHWYIALRTNHLAENTQIFQHFSYETRVSSREFIQHLCQMDSAAFNNQSRFGIVEYLRNQTWFYSRYAQDPTVQGMLRTLGGTKMSNSKGEDIKDGIEEFLKEDDCEQYWSLLTSVDCPITFVYHEMKDENLPLSDDLYVKMNARGKQLTDFENFKADLIDYSPNSDAPSVKMLDAETASLIDNSWTDVFWKEACAKKVYQVDGIFFKFLKNYFLNKFIATSELSIDKLQNHIFYQRVYSERDIDKEYTGIGLYRDVLSVKVIAELVVFFDRWKQFQLEEKDFQPLWNADASFYPIPRYVKQGEAVSVFDFKNQKERAVFYAVCAYLESNETYSADKFKSWMCFVWNVVENSNLTTDEAMIGAIRLFHELEPYSGNIISYLASNGKISSKYAERQIEEERYKATLMIGERGTIWKETIRTAESNKFLKGNISCLLRKGTAKYVDDIDDFKTKYAHVCLYFDDDMINEKYQVRLTKALMSCCHSFDQLCYGNKCFVFDTSAENWKLRFLNKPNDSNAPTYYDEIDKLLLVNDLTDIPYVNICNPMESWSGSANRIKEILAKTDMLDEAIVFKGSKWRLNWYYGSIAFYPFGGHHAYIFDWYDSEKENLIFRRNELLHHDNIKVSVAKQYYPAKGGVYGDWAVYFDYNGYSFYWDWNNEIYLIDEQGNKIERKRKYANSEKDQYFVIKMQQCSGITQRGLLLKLTNLGQEYYG